MNINDILNNEELKGIIKNSIGKTYNRYKLNFIIEQDDFVQECYINIMKKIKYYDNTKSSLKTFIPMLIMSCAKDCIKKVNGQSKNYNKLEYANNTFNIDDLIVSEDNNTLNNLVCNTIDNTYNNIVIKDILSLNNLSSKQKLIIKLMYKGFNYTEISIMLKCSKQNILYTFQRAKEKIVNNYND